MPCYPNAPFSFVFTESLHRLQNVALVLALERIALTTRSSKKCRTRREKNSQNVKHFSLKDFAGFLPIR